MKKSPNVPYVAQQTAVLTKLTKIFFIYIMDQRGAENVVAGGGDGGAGVCRVQAAGGLGNAGRWYRS